MTIQKDAFPRIVIPSEAEGPAFPLSSSLLQGPDRHDELR
jgi:hypothetical protein